MASDPIEVTKVLQNTNIAEMLSEEQLNEIGHSLLKYIAADDDSRREWLAKNEEYVNLALQVVDEKSFPWPNAANVKYPLLTLATLQFHARAQETLLRGADLVKAKAMPSATAKPEAEARRNRVSKFMSYQYLEMMPDWPDDMDRLLLILPIVGMAYTKTRFNGYSNKNITSLVLAKDLILNYRAKDFVQSRKTELLCYSTNQIETLIRSDYFLDVDYLSDIKNTSNNEENTVPKRIGINPTDVDEFVDCYESHCWLDLDDDGFKEPYIVWLTDKGTILRIQARWASDDVILDEEGEIVDITPLESYTRYIFLPDPESPLYGLGLGSILGPLNEGVNTLINQLIDAGTLNILPSGFLGRGVRTLRGGEVKLAPGQWKQLASTGDDLRKGIYPIPAKDPSAVLFNLLGLLIDSGKNVGSIGDMILGENPGQNQPTQTSQMVLDQGLKVFSGIYKRIYRSLSDDYKKLYKFNYLYLDEAMYQAVMDDPAASKTDFDGMDYDIVPNADPDILSEYQSMFKAQSLLQKLQMGLAVNPQVVTKRVLEAEKHENIEELMTMQPPQPPPDIMIKMQEMQMADEHKKIDVMLEMNKQRTEEIKARAAAMANIAKAESLEAGSQFNMYKLQLEQLGMAIENANTEKEQLLKLIEIGVNKEKNDKQQQQSPSRSSGNSGSSN